MLRGIYISASGLQVQQSGIDITAHNIANVATQGYKQSRLNAESFPEVLLMRLGPSRETASLGQASYGGKIAEIKIGFEQGPLENTRNLKDVALTGNGFLIVDTGGGERYFRGGCLSVDSEGFLVTGGGDRVLGEEGPLEVRSGQFQISPDGTVTVGDRRVGKLAMVDFEDLNMLAKEDKGYFRNEGSQESDPVAFIQQGYLEGSNVDWGAEMARLFLSLRAYQLNQRALRVQEETLDKAINQVGSMR
jgi:flagellar basal-body rod protein FlgG